MEIRVTSLETFERCQRQWFAESVLGMRKDNALADEGTATHSVAERYFKAWKAAGFPANFRFDFQTTAREEIARFSTLTEASLPEVVRMARKCVPIFAEAGFDYDLRVEQTMRWNIGTHTIKGTADVLMLPVFPGEAIKIRDFKTGRNRKITRQLKIYTLLALNSIVPNAPRESNVRYEWVRLGEQDEFTYTAAELDETERWVRQQVEKIDALLRKGEDAFACETGSLCGYCAYAEQCPAVNGTYQPMQVAEAPEEVEIPLKPELLDKEMAEKLALQQIGYQAKADQLEDCLKAWCEKNGPLTAGGLYFGKEAVSPSKKYDFKAVWNRILEKGLNPMEVLSVSATDATNLAKKGVDLDGTFTAKATSPRWSRRKVKPEEMAAQENALPEPQTQAQNTPQNAQDAPQEEKNPETVLDILAGFGTLLKASGAPESALNCARDAYKMARAGDYGDAFFDQLVCTTAWEIPEDKKAVILSIPEQIEAKIKQMQRAA